MDRGIRKVVMKSAYRILHLTDFHFDTKKAEDQKIVVSELKNDLARITRDKVVDLIIFSGDLVNRGSDKQSFESAKQLLLDNLRDELNLTDEDIVICPGNHDVDQKAIEDHPYIEPGLKAHLNSSDNLNRHVDKYFHTPIPDDEANGRLANYFDFVRKYYHGGASLKSNYVDCLVKSTQVGKIGFASLNSAWRSTGAGEIERNLMLISERVVEAAASQLKHCDLKIAIVHHPLDWLAAWDAKAVRIPLFVNFDLIAFGHVHEDMPSLVKNSIGECLLAQGGALYLHREYYNGFQLIDISPDGLEAQFQMRSWFNQPRRSFGAAENICAGGVKSFQLRQSESQSDKLSVNELLTIQNAVDEAANAHLKTMQLKTDIAFEQSFTCPPLSHQTANELISLRPIDYKNELLQLSDLFSDDGVKVISGARESGKTTIALKIAKDSLRTENKELRLPIVVNFSKLKKYDSLENLVRRYITSLELDIAANRITGNHRCRFVVDNVSLDDQEKLVRLRTLIRESEGKHDWIIFLDSVDLLSRDNIAKEFGATKGVVFILPFGRSEIRALVTKVSGPSNGVGEVDTIIKLMDDNELPRNPYIVTLLISVLTDIAVDSVINEATLLDKMIDLLLNKQDPSNIIRSSTDFAGRNILLEQIALWLNDNDGTLQENELLSRLARFLKERGIQEGAGSLLHNFIRVGIIERRSDEISFRYRSFQSFFLARYAARNKDYAPKLLEKMAILKHRKEFSLLCDLSRKDADLLSYLEVVILELHPLIFSAVDKSAFLKGGIKGDFGKIVDEKLSDISGGPQSLRAIDEMNDFQDRAKASLSSQIRGVEPKYPSEGTDAEEEEKLQKLLRGAAYFEAWRTWGRAITSLDFVELSVRKPSFIKLLDHWAQLAAIISLAGTKFLQELSEDATKDGKAFSKQMKEKFAYVVQVNMPMSSAQAIFSHIGSSSVHQLLLDAFDEVDIQSPEALGAACLLIRQRPDGWASRIERYVDLRDPKGTQGIAQYFLLEALYQKFYFSHSTPAELSALESAIAHLLSHAGFVRAKKKAIVQSIEKIRPRIELLTREIKR
jgi:3',5'-cyclic AMP phosphodiesterase CpdA